MPPPAPAPLQGDSGFIVIRGTKVVSKSKPLQHYFDCPLQFGAFPEFVEATDTADMADTYSIPLVPGDVIVAGALGGEGRDGQGRRGCARGRAGGAGTFSIPLVPRRIIAVDTGPIY